jgi:hypothetical protein
MSSDYLKCIKKYFEDSMPIPQFLSSSVLSDLNGVCDSKVPSYQDKLNLQNTVNSLKTDSTWNDCYLKIKENKLDQSQDEF